VYVTDLPNTGELIDGNDEWYSNVFTLDLDTLIFNREEITYPLTELSVEGDIVSITAISFLGEE